jgi:hypothetical protein
MSPTISKDQSLKPQGRLQLNAHIPGVAGLFFAVILTVNMLGGIWLSTNGFLSDSGMAIWTIGWGLVGLYILLGLKVASQWQKAVVLRLGKFHKLAGPGMFWLIPVIDTLANWIDHRVMVTPFSAEKTLTKDTVPVDVDAVLFWVVWDAEKAALEVADYRAAIAWAAQTALRDALFNGAWVASCRDPVWRGRYAQLRQRGKTHAHALRIIGAQLLRVAIALLKEGVPYDRTRLKRKTDPKESARWWVAEPSGLPATPEREPGMALGG